MAVKLNNSSDGPIYLTNFYLQNISPTFIFKMGKNWGFIWNFLPTSETFATRCRVSHKMKYVDVDWSSRKMLICGCWLAISKDEKHFDLWLPPQVRLNQAILYSLCWNKINFVIFSSVGLYLVALLIKIALSCDMLW